ncbi:MAG: hypothetical protein QF732_05610 [Nitrospinaceae bacterium]|jgi:hypothetical protein|nr:hypothetical protein [Nitrospinaceae bacterium]
MKILIAVMLGSTIVLHGCTTMPGGRTVAEQLKQETLHRQVTQWITPARNRTIFICCRFFSYVWGISLCHVLTHTH